MPHMPRDGKPSRAHQVAAHARSLRLAIAVGVPYAACSFAVLLLASWVRRYQRYHARKLESEVKSLH
eukprot:2763476-Prymnesium_polylepis.1